MTGPIVFTPMPAPSLDDLCDGVSAFRNVSTVGNANFAKLKTYPLTTPVTTISETWNQQGGVWEAPSTATWSTVPSYILATRTITLPNPVAAVMITVTARVMAQGVWAIMHLGFNLNGPGVYWTHVVENTSVGAHGCIVQGSRVTLLHGSQVGPGAMTVTPRAFSYGGRVEGASITVTTFTGSI